MTLALFAIVGMGILAMLLSSKYHRMMNGISVAHAAAYLLLAIYTLLYVPLPSYYVEGRYFFIDYLGIFEVLISSLVFIMASAYAGGYVESLMKAGELNRGNLKLFYISLNLLLMSATASFFSNNLALFWISVELTTIFSALLIVTLNAKENIEAALKYVFIPSVSMLFTFIGFIFLFAMTQQALGQGTLNWDMLMAHASQLPASLVPVTFVLIFAGLASKGGIVPFHTWLPHAHAKAPSVISAILSSVILNVGIYGILRMYSIFRQTGSAGFVSQLLIFFGLASIAIASLSMLQQRNLKKLIAFSSTENMGLILIGIGLGTPAAIFWILFHKLAHSIAKPLLFFSSGIVHRQYRSNESDAIRGLLKLQPFASWGLIIGSAAIIGMPPFALFISKISIFLQIASASPALLLAVLLLLIVAASAIARYLARIFSQPEVDGKLQQYAVPLGMKLPIIAAILILIALGLFPNEVAGLLDAIIKGLGM